MRCPRCKSDNIKVLESRAAEESNQIRRRRVCLDCGHRFTTYERIEERPIVVIKKDGRRQSFDIDKVRRGIKTSCEKLNINDKDIDQMLSRIEDNLDEKLSEGNTISSSEIGDEILKELYTLSPVAYVRFASVYKKFSDIDQFLSEIKSIAKNKKNSK